MKKKKKSTLLLLPESYILKARWWYEVKTPCRSSAVWLPL